MNAPHPVPASAPLPVPPAGCPKPAPPADAGQRAGVAAGGTMWRLRSLVAMGHSTGRIAAALGVSESTARRLLTGTTATVSPRLRDLSGQLWDAWWDKRPPEDTPAQHRAAAASRHHARRQGWCTPLGLDEDYLDEPGYRPYAIWRPAIGTGVAAPFPPGPAAASTQDAPGTAASGPSRLGPEPGRPAAPVTAVRSPADGHSGRWHIPVAAGVPCPRHGGAA